MTAFAFALLLLCVVLGFVLVGYCAVILNEVRQARDTQAALSRQIADLRSDIGQLYNLAAGIDRALADFIEELSAPPAGRRTRRTGRTRKRRTPLRDLCRGRRP